MVKYLSICCFVVVFFYTDSLFAQPKRPEVREAGDEERIEYELTRTVDPATGQLPPDIKTAEREFVSKLPVHDPFSLYKKNSPLSENWIQLGPRNQPGRTQAVAIDITNKNNILLGSATGGVWRTIDNGTSWVKVTESDEVQCISSIVQDRRVGKTSTWYYSTGELLSTTDRRHTQNIRTHLSGNGIYRSTNSGASWTPLASTQTRNGVTAPHNFQGIWNLVLDHRNATQDIIYAACFGGIMRSPDAGATWQLVLGSDSDECFNADIVIGTNGTLYAGLSSAFNGVASPKQGIWTSKDGISWTKISTEYLPALFRRIRLAIAPSNDSILYSFAEAPVDWSAADLYFESTHALSKFTITGTASKWTDFTPFLEKMPQELSNDGFSTLAGYALTIAVKPTNPNVVVFGGTNLYRSVNGLNDPDGYVNNKIGGYPYIVEDDNLHPDIHVLLFDPSDPNKLYVGTDGGLFSTDNIQASPPTWAQNSNGVESSQFYDARLDKDISGDGFIVGGLQDNSSYMTDDMNPDHDWLLTSGGDGLTCAIINGPDLFATSSQSGYTYFLGYDGFGINFYGYAIPEEDLALPFDFYTRFTIDEQTRNTMYLAQMNNLWRLDGLQSIPGGLVDNTLWLQYETVGNSIGDANSITSFASSPSSKLYIGSTAGHLFVLTNPDDLSATPTDITSAVFPKGAFPASIDIDPVNENNILLSFSNYNVQSIFSSTDGGNSWKAVSGNLESKPDGSGVGPSVRCVKVLHTPSGDIYYAATSSGLVSTTKLDGMNTVWVREAITTIGSLIVENIDVRQSDGKVICATQGGGVFTNTAPSSVRSENTETKQNLVVEQNYPNPVRDHSAIAFSLHSTAAVSIELFDALGKDRGEVIAGTFDRGRHVIGIDLSSALWQSLGSGVYFYRVSAGSEAITKRIVISK